MNQRKKAMWITYALTALLLCVLGLWRADATGIYAPRRATPSPFIPPVSASGTPSPVPPTVPASTPDLPSPSPVSLQGPFELPLEGATGYATIGLSLRREPNAAAERLQTLPAGTGFRIVREEGAYWHVSHLGFSGYVAHQYCMINLPDILPSIVYENTNASASIIRTSGKHLPGVTGEKLYDGSAYNSRLERQEFIMPVLYGMAKKIGVAQQTALSEGNSLKIYEAYRPYSAQRRVVNALNALAQEDAAVQKGISTAPWKVSWFASQGISHHQRGCAIDVSLVHVQAKLRRTSGAYSYLTVTEYTEYTMPTPMHELSIAAAAFQAPVSSTSKTAWLSAEPAAAMNSAAKSLQRYCSDAGMTPLASEWWHFNDLDAYARVKDHAGEGGTVLANLYSRSPSR